MINHKLDRLRPIQGMREMCSSKGTEYTVKEEGG